MESPCSQFEGVFCQGELRRRSSATRCLAASRICSKDARDSAVFRLHKAAARHHRRSAFENVEEASPLCLLNKARETREKIKKGFGDSHGGHKGQTRSRRFLGIEFKKRG